MKRRSASSLLAALLLALSGVTLPAQVLARPGWAGSGVAVEPWWHHAVFYRIDVARFQDGTGAGCGNLAGVVQRLDYLQSLGVDALILAPGFDRAAADSSTCGSRGAAQAGSAEGLDDLARQAASHKLRVLVELDAPTSQSSEVMGKYVAQARAWLNQGAAGVYVRTPQLAALKDPNLAAYLVRQLRSLARSVPGERIVIADTAADPGGLLGRAVAHEAQLLVNPPVSLSPPTAAGLRQQMVSGLASASSLTTILRANRQLPPGLTAQQKGGLQRAAAAMLLASRTAVLIDYGQELGEQQASSSPSTASLPAGQPARESPAVADSLPPLMQWTPTNLTRDPKAATTDAAPANPDAGYGTFHEYVKPLPRTLFPRPPLPDVVLSDTPPAVEPNTLPGFTTGTIDPALAAAAGGDAGAVNVAVEDADPSSLLNLYRRLIQLHHENASVRNGSQEVLNYDAVNALVWLRRAPAGSRTSATVVVACNLSAQPFVVPQDVLGGAHGRRAPVRNLLNVASPAVPAQALARGPDGDLTVGPGHVFLGELHP